MSSTINAEGGESNYKRGSSFASMEECGSEGNLYKCDMMQHIL